jgi:hypothetical protein
MCRFIPITCLLALIGCGSSRPQSNPSTAQTVGTAKTTPTSAPRSTSSPSIRSLRSAFRAHETTLHTLDAEAMAIAEGANRRASGALLRQFEGSLASRATVLARTLAQLIAPSQYRSELAALQSSLTQVAVALRAMEAAAAAHDRRAARAAGQNLAIYVRRGRGDDTALGARLGVSLGR